MTEEHFLAPVMNFIGQVLRIGTCWEGVMEALSKRCEAVAVVLP